MFPRVLRTEFLKLRRTVALKMALLAPFAVTLMTFFIASQSPFTMLRRNGMTNDWLALAHLNFVLWGLLMLPLYITVQSALVAGIDHAENQWKSLLARPIPRPAFYIAKLTVLMTLALLSTLVLLAGVFASGLLLPYLQNTATFHATPPVTTILRQGCLMTALGFLALTLQHWVSLRWRSFAVSTGAGVVAIVIGYGMTFASQPNGAWTQYFPWSLPMLVLAKWPVNLTEVFAFTVLLGILSTAAGCLEFSRREVS